MHPRPFFLQNSEMHRRKFAPGEGSKINMQEQQCLFEKSGSKKYVIPCACCKDLVVNAQCNFGINHFFYVVQSHYLAFLFGSPTVSVTRGWVGRGNAVLTDQPQARKLPENAQTPTRRVHAVLGCF